MAMKISRRKLLAVAGASAAYAAMGRAGRVFARPDNSADLFLKGGAIVTMNDAKPFATALAVKGGRILAVGGDQELASYLGEKTKVIDLSGKGVSPGLIDAHSHLIPYGHMELFFTIIRPPKVTDFASLQNALKTAAKKKPEGEWIVGRGFQDFKEGRFPRRQDLDAAVPNHPLLIIHWSGQYGIANTLALKKAGLFKSDTPDPYGGKFLRERQTGLPDGMLLHYPAIYAVYEPKISEEEQLKCARWAVDRFIGAGVTCIHDNFAFPSNARLYVRMDRSEQLKARIRVYLYVANLKQTEEYVPQIRRYKGPLVRMQGIKLAVDGYALMYETPAEQQHLAIPMHPQLLFEDIIGTIHRADFQADVHAVGDKGVDWTLAAFAKAAGSIEEARRRRHRIEHFPFRKPDSIRKAAELNVPVCTQPSMIDFRVDDFQRRLGNPIQNYISTIIPMRTFLKENVPMAFGADVPAFPYFSPLDSLRSAVGRKTGAGRQLDPAESISFLEALKVHTLGSAYAAFDEKELGSLEPDKNADFVIWDKDLRKVKTAADIKNLHVKATYLAGACVYEAEKT
jgi:predicted amidohydrolase YtcJ